MRNSVVYTLAKVALLCLSFVYLSSCGNGAKTPPQETQDSTSTIGRLNRKVAENPGDVDAWFARSRYYAEQEVFNKALMDAEKALSLDSFRTDILLHAADLYYTTREVEQARATIQKALALDPNNLDANLRMGELQYYLGQYPSAFEYLDKAILLDPFEARTYFTKGMIFAETGDTNLAISSFQTAVEQDPTYFHAYMQLANLHAAKNNDLAIDYYQNAISVNPTKQEAYYGLAYYLQYHNRPKEAIRVYQDLLAFDKNHVPSIHNIGYIFLFEEGKATESLTWFNRALNHEPDFYLALYHKGYALELLGQQDSARIFYEKALSQEPELKVAQAGLERLGS